MLTITQAQEGLTATRPVKVFTHHYPQYGPAVPRPFHVEPPIEPWLMEDCTGYPAHDHDHYEIVFVLGGRGVHETAGGRSVVEAGHVHVLAPGEIHGYHDADGLELTLCAYLGEWLLTDLHELLTEGDLIPLFLHTVLRGTMTRTDVPQWTIDEATLRECMGELADIGRELERERPSLIRMKSSLKKLMVALERSFAQSGAHLVLSADPWIRSTLQRLEEVILQGECLSVSELAAEHDMDPKGFSRAFHEAVGSSPTQYYQHRRVQRACWMLLHSGRSITEIAHLLGYTDSAHFTHLFKRERGMTPKEYRRKYQGD